jgi:excisionase family DNA binding protein
MTATNEIEASAWDEADEDLDRILGDQLLFTIRDAAKLLNVSTPTVYRAMGRGTLPFVKNGNRRNITRPVMKRRIREGLGPLT